MTRLSLIPARDLADLLRALRPDELAVPFACAPGQTVTDAAAFLRGTATAIDAGSPPAYERGRAALPHVRVAPRVTAHEDAPAQDVPEPLTVPDTEPEPPVSPDPKPDAEPAVPPAARPKPRRRPKPPAGPVQGSLF
jgi:outer membrane biosynthesis protein TonB